jgi:hypothetical protein
VRQTRGEAESGISNQPNASPISAVEAVADMGKPAIARRWAYHARTGYGPQSLLRVAKARPAPGCRHGRFGPWSCENPLEGSWGTGSPGGALRSTEGGSLRAVARAESRGSKSGSVRSSGCNSPGPTRHMLPSNVLVALVRIIANCGHVFVPLTTRPNPYFASLPFLRSLPFLSSLTSSAPLPSFASLALGGGGWRG